MVADRAVGTTKIVEGEALLERRVLNPRTQRAHDPVWILIGRQPRGQPQPGAEPDHVSAESDARRALHRFLAGFGIASDEHGRELTERLLAGARRYHRDQPQMGLAACAILHAEQQFEAWLGAVLAPELAAGQPALAAGRAAFLSCGGPAAWSGLILVHDDLPDSFVSGMRAAMPPLSPMPAPATMAAQTLESWSIVEVVRAALDLLGTTFAWAASARPLVAPAIKLTKPWS